MSLQIQILGAVRVRRAGEIVPLGAVKCLAMLTALTVNCNQPVSLEDMIGAVWGDDPPRSAVGNLRNYAGTLRRAVGDQLTTVVRGYQLTMRRGERDVDEFRRLATDGRAALAADDPVAAATALTESLALWRGPAGQGLPAGTALGVELINLGDERLAAFDDLIDVRLRLGHQAALVPILRKHLHRYPLRERSWAQLTIAQYRAGGAAAALATYADSRRTLRDQLGIEPGPQLTDLQRAILTRSPDLMHSPPAAALATPHV